METNLVCKIIINISGTGADIMKRGLIRSEEDLEGIDANPLLLVHDEIVWEVKVYVQSCYQEI